MIAQPKKKTQQAKVAWAPERLNKTQARLLTHVVCDGEDYANDRSEKIAASQLEKLGFVTVHKETDPIPDHPESITYYYKVKATKAGRKRILG